MTVDNYTDTFTNRPTLQYNQTSNSKPKVILIGNITEDNTTYIPPVNI